jgi:hypothetical protein
MPKAPKPRETRPRPRMNFDAVPIMSRMSIFLASEIPSSAKRTTKPRDMNTRSPMLIHTKLEADEWYASVDPT